jgi:carboxymethylenebutenolidase
MPEVQIPWNGSEAAGYLAVPESGSGPGTIVLQEWWGLDDTIRAVCDNFARDGFVALAPDLFGRATTEEPSEAERLVMNMKMDDAAKQMSGAVDLLAGHEATSGKKVGSMGYCIGGGLSIWAASVNDKVGAAVSYYGVFPHGKPDFSTIKVPVQGHFGTNDDFVSADDARALEQELKNSGVDAEFFYYEGCGHAFASEHDRIGTRDDEAAALAWQRTTDFLRSNLG